MYWHQVCHFRSLPIEYGVAVLLGDEPVALFRTAADELFALSNVDPFSGAGVLSKGIVGDRSGEPTVASPLHKQVFSMRTGVCLDEPDTQVRTYPVRYRDGGVEIAILHRQAGRGREAVATG